MVEYRLIDITKGIYTYELLPDGEEERKIIIQLDINNMTPDGLKILYISKKSRRNDSIIVHACAEIIHNNFNEKGMRAWC